MISSEQNVETILRLITNAKKYGNMRLDTFERSTADKLATVISALIMGLVIFVVSLIVIVFFSAAIVVWIAPHIGGYLPALLIVGGFYTAALLFVYAKRHSLIAMPIRAAITHIFFAGRADAAAPTEEEMAEARQAFVDDYESLTAPPSPARNKFEFAMQTAGKAWTLVDGLILGYKLYKKLGISKRGKKRW